MTDQNNSLSDREIEILKLVAKGLTNRKIAYKLTISPNTVKVHLSNIFEKISVASRTEATLYGIEHGLVDVPGRDEPTVVIEEPKLADYLRKYIWLILPLVLLVIALFTITVINLVKPKPPEALPLGETTERWKELASMPAARAGIATATYDGKIYAIAGEGAEGISGNVFRYLPNTDSWEQLADKPIPVADVHSVLIGEKIYIPGGRLSDGNPTDILEIYNPRQNSWTAGAPMPQPISGYALAGYEGQMYLFGGWDGTDALDVVFVYNPQADSWQLGTPLTAPRQNAGAVALADKIILLGGKDAEGALNTAESYYPSRDADGENPWEAFIELPEGRYGFGIATVSEAIYIIGGLEDIQTENSIGIFLNEGEWNGLETTLVKSPQSPELISIGSWLYLINRAESFEQGELRAYKAHYYEIFLPIIQ